LKSLFTLWNASNLGNKFKREKHGSAMDELFVVEMAKKTPVTMHVAVGSIITWKIDRNPNEKNKFAKISMEKVLRL